MRNEKNIFLFILQNKVNLSVKRDIFGQYRRTTTTKAHLIDCAYFFKYMVSLKKSFNFSKCIFF